jgi:hypothetical protein
MDVRASANPVLASARRWLARVNARHRGATTSTSTAGSCGTCQPAAGRRWMSAAGRVLAGKLAPHFARVTGIDADAA